MPRRDSRNATRARVLAAADRLFVERGFAATTVREIATACEVSVGTVMSVGDKESLLVQVFDQHVAQLQSRRPASEPAASSDTERILALVAPIVELYIERAELARTYASILVGARHSSILIDELAAQLIEEFTGILAGDQPRPSPEDRALATALYHAFVGVLYTGAARPGASLQQLPETLRSTVTALLTTREHPC
ncbi:TetR/AcrR family transcriptional regulator [Brachybacterium sp. YJGR34]|uniref:TetR/AcrR family transcriptional regulator n=1 Tax=Brachybacterium sp. YJGR34 TaxID=2059911 RepID=UPI000E0A79BD|nr:TetR/AcrR family transcriptional regulator [Brachybacterium sp. YJGR34]